MEVSQPLAATLVFLTVLGLGGWGPRALDPQGIRLGLRVMLGTAILPAALFWLAAILNLPLSLSAAAVAAVATLGLARLARLPGILATHPVFVLTALVVLGLMAFGPVGFHVPSWDDYTNWLGMARRMFLADSFVLDGIPGGLKRDYLPGWMLMLGFPAFLSGHFNDGSSALVSAVVHIAALGLVFDVVRAWRARHGGADSILFGWGAVVLILGAEGLWKLVPYLVWVELVQSAFVSAALALIVLASAEPEARRPLAVAAGVFVTAAILAKVSSIVALPAIALGFFLLRPRAGMGERVLLAGLAAIVPLVTLLAWTAIKPAGGNACVASVASILIAGAGAIGQSGASHIIGTVGGAMLAYVGDYKWLLTVGAALALGVGAVLRPGSMAPLAASAGCFALAYAAGVVWTYLGCPNSFNYLLSSLQRYLQVPLRAVHVTGLLALVLLAADGWRGTLALPVRRGMALAVVVFVGWQALQVRHSLTAMTEATTATTAMRGLLLELPGQTEALMSWARERGLGAPRVALLDHAPNTFAAVLADYHALPDRRERRQAWPAFREHLLSPSADSPTLEDIDLLWVLNDDARPSWLPAGTCPGSAAFEIRDGAATGACITLGKAVSAREP